MKNISQNMVTQQNNSKELNNHKISKRKFNHSGKENVDPAPTTKTTTKQDVSACSNSKKAKITIQPTATNETLKKLPVTYFDALLDLCANEHDYLTLAEDDNLSQKKKDSLATEILLNDPFFNNLVNDLQKLPDEIQILISEFKEFDAEFIVRNNYLLILHKTLKCQEANNFTDLPSIKYAAYPKDILLNRIWITLRQRDELQERKCLKLTQINERLKKIFNETGIHVETNSVAPSLDEKKIINSFQYKIKSNLPIKRKASIQTTTIATTITTSIKSKKTKTKTKQLGSLQKSKQILAKEKTESIKKKFAPKNKPIKPEPKYKEYSNSETESTPSSSQQSTIYSDESKEIFCICKKESSGHMVECDNKNCKIGWFHFKCVGIHKAPKGDWYCTRCSENLKKH